jgi:SAM-dependent methyltransferase
MSLAIWRFITLLLTGLVMGTSLCHVLEMPVKMQADGPLWTTLQHVLYRHFASVGGTVEIGAVLSAALLSHRVRGHPRAFRLTLLGAVFLAAAFVVWLWFVNPVNAETALWSVESVPAHWAARRACWEYGHAVRFALHLIAFSALTLSVLDVGSGNGTLAFALAEHVKPGGRVFATEIDAKKIAKLRKAVSRSGLDAVTIVGASATESGLPEGCCDAILLRGVYHHLTEPAAVLVSLRRALRPGGRLLVIDFAPVWWLAPWTPKGIPKDRGGHGIRPQIVIREAEAARFELERPIEKWSGSWFLRLYAVVFRAPVGRSQPPGREPTDPDDVCPRWAAIHTVVCTQINAPPERVAALYADYEGWPQLFPATIRGVRLLADDGQRKTIEVDHASEGKVINIMTALSPLEIRLEEFKRRFDARFINRFEAVGEGTRYSIVADVRLKGAARALGPLVTPIVRARLNRFVLEPMRAAVEGGMAAREDRRLD